LIPYNINLEISLVLLELSYLENQKNYICRPYSLGDEGQIVELLKLVFGGWPKSDFKGTSVDHWRWKYSGSPLKHSNTVVAESSGKIVGVNHGILLKIKIGNKTIIGQKGADVAVHPDFRRMGVFNNVLSLKNKLLEEHGYNFLYWLSSNPILINRVKRRIREGRNTSQFPHPIIYLIRIQDIDKHLQYNEYDKPDVVLKYGFLGAKILSRLELKRRIKKQSEFQVSEIAKFGVEINKFWEQVKTGYEFIVEKTMDYLNWRYCDPRGGFYKVLVAKDKRGIVGYIVYKVSKHLEEYPVGYIMEVLTLPDRVDVVEALIGNVVKRFFSMGVNVVHAQIVKGHPYEAYFKHYDFVDSRVKPFLWYRPVSLDINLKQFVNATPDRLNYQYGESDSI
jgi:hypothetical protein